MATQSETAPDSSVAPETVFDALKLTISPGAQALLDAAGLIAAKQNRDIGAEQLFVGALAIGVQYSRMKLDPTAADPWLYDWCVEQAGKAAVDYFIQAEVQDAFPLPLQRFPDGFSSESTGTTQNIALSRQAGALLKRASLIGSTTVGDNRYGVRHIVSSLILHDASGANTDLHRNVLEALKITLTNAADVILKNATSNISDTRTREVWKEVFANPPPTSPATRATFITLPGFAADGLGVGDSDPLGIDPDVKAFARLICLEQATPPLSICLFGEWGSGKSTFMERLQREIPKLAKPKSPRGTASAAPVVDDEPTFVENIVQIRFNAWHFADASLWASLTAVFFDQLRRGGYDGGPTFDYQALIGKVAHKVRSLEAGAATALEKVEDAKRKSDAAHKALDATEKQLAANDLTLAWTQLQSDLKQLQETNKEKLQEVGRRIYRDDLSTDTKAFAMAVQESASTPGRLALIGRVLVSGGWSTGLGIIAIALVAGIGILWPRIDPTIAAWTFQRIAAWGVGPFAALGALWQAIKTAKPILDGTFKYAKAVEDGRAELTQQVETKRLEAGKASKKLNEAEVALTQAREPLSNYLSGVPADAPSTILRYFLFEDGDVRDYDKQVGIVSRARRSFEQLNSIVSTTRTTRKKRKLAEEKRAAGKELSPEEKALLATADGKGPLVPDRIILYIDDLDRCTHDQVYSVLQAIHLLLAFELFVVVVGVDVQWIEGAVAKHFEADLSQASSSEQRRKRAIDYLEKIFQIPFWLQRLNTGSETGPAGGSYAAYVGQLLKDNERSASGPNPFRSFATSEKMSMAAGVPPQLGASAPGAMDATTTDRLPPEAEFSAVDAALASMKLEKEEIGFLKGPKIGAIASKSPRAVKRLINIYRIVRARLSDRDLERFLGRSGTPPRYPIIALLSAIETGQPIELAESLYPALALLPKDGRMSDIWEKAGKKGSGISKNATAALLRARKAAPGLGSALTAVDQACGTEGATVGSYIEMARLVRRYSFNRYG
jgi:nitroreductase